MSKVSIATISNLCWRLLANGFGVHDIIGNVREWYSEYSDELVIDPQGPANGSYKVYRGGNWFYCWLRELRCAYRARKDKDYRFFDLGGHLAFSLESSN